MAESDHQLPRLTLDPGVASRNSFKLSSALIRALMSATLAIFLASTTESRAGFFEELFGIDQTPGDQRDGGAGAGEAPRQGSASSPRHGTGEQTKSGRAESASKPRSARNGDESTRKVRARFCGGRETDAAQTDALLHDATLRSGDSVVTKDGVRVFVGGSACPHEPSDFVALSAARHLTTTQRATLVAIEQNLKLQIDTAPILKEAKAAQASP